MRLKSSLMEQQVIPWPLPALLSNGIKSSHQRATAESPAISCKTALLISKETTQPGKVKLSKAYIIPIYMQLLLAQIKAFPKRSQRAALTTTKSVKATDPSEITKCGEATGRGDQASAGSTSSYSIGTTVAMYLPQYRDELPLIGKVVSVNVIADQVTVHWYVGTYSGIWKPCRRRDGRNYVDWEEAITIVAVLCTVNLTKSFKLPKSTVLELKEAYRKFI